MQIFEYWLDTGTGQKVIGLLNVPFHFSEDRDDPLGVDRGL
jgi:hypothetical protein